MKSNENIIRNENINDKTERNEGVKKVMAYQWRHQWLMKIQWNISNDVMSINNNNNGENIVMCNENGNTSENNAMTAKMKMKRNNQLMKIPIAVISQYNGMWKKAKISMIMTYQYNVKY